MILRSFIDDALKKTHNCSECYRSNARIACIHCRIAVYCSDDCKQKDRLHPQICQKISGCENHTILERRTRNLEPFTTEEVENQKVWNKYIQALWKEALRASSTRINFFVHKVLYFILRNMLMMGSKLYRSLVLQLPQLMIMNGNYALCHEVLFRSKLQLIPSPKWQELLGKKQHGAKYYSIIDTPIQSMGMDRPLCPILVMNLIFVKLQLKNRIESLLLLTSRMTFQHLNLVADFLGLPTSWERVLPKVVERQCMDLIKLNFRQNPHFVPMFLRRCGLVCRQRIDIDTLSMRALNNYLMLHLWAPQKDHVQFVKEISSDMIYYSL